MKIVGERRFRNGPRFMTFLLQKFSGPGVQNVVRYGHRIESVLSVQIDDLFEATCTIARGGVDMEIT